NRRRTRRRRPGRRRGGSPRRARPRPRPRGGGSRWRASWRFLAGASGVASGGAGGADGELVAGLAHADAGVRAVLGAVLHPALRHAAGQRGDAVRDLDGDVARVQVRGFGEALVEVLADALVGALVVARSDAAVVAAAEVASAGEVAVAPAMRVEAAVRVGPAAEVHLVVAVAGVVALQVAVAARARGLALRVLPRALQPVLRGARPVPAHAQHVLRDGPQVGDRGLGHVLVVAHAIV